ncbi:MAG: tetratricopeptide repeat protein, partial [Spirochaetales bacterium]|nr:tetratricopeptide repeat protein [Spirochaetales bacterium]
VEALKPTLYTAPLFIGDCYYLLNQLDNAEAAFARAVEIDPNRETAYRYWGDALMKTGKMEEARSKFIEAVVAEPYKALPWNGLKQWAMFNNKQIGHLKFRIPVSILPDGTIRVDENTLDVKDGTQGWLTYYGLIRNLWRKEIFPKTYPDESQYRHSLPEECDAIRIMLQGINDQISKGELKSSDIDGPIQFLMKLNSEGLLEAYVLLALADEAIIEDYELYRKDNREPIGRYLDLYAIHDK